MKRYVVTGATSMLGSELTNQLSSNNIVYAIVRKNSSNFKNLKMNNNVRLLYFDMHEYGNIELDTSIIDGVFHFAWEGVRNPFRNDELMQRRNFQSSVTLYNRLKIYKPNFFVGIGSQAEYGTYSIPYSEDLKCIPDIWYGKYKYEFYKYLSLETVKDNIRLIWARVFSAFGPKDYKDSLLMTSIRKMKKNEQIELTPCIHMWTFTYFKDVIKGILLLVKGDCSGIYNVSNSDNIPLKEYIIRLRTLLKSKSILEFGYFKYNDNKIPNMIVDNTKLVNDTSYCPDYCFEDGIKEILEEIENDN